MRNYVSLIMDIEKSRKYVTEDRIELQKDCFGDLEGRGAEDRAFHERGAS